jgi:hypothetical protein
LSSLARTIALAFTTLVLALALTSCFRFAVFQGVSVFPTPEDPSMAYCHQLHVTAIFGTRTLFDTTFSVGDDEVAAIEVPRADHYRGMPLTIDITCYDTDDTVIGQSHHLGRLQDPSGWANVVVVNYPLHADCVPPVHATGTQVCLSSSGGFDWD